MYIESLELKNYRNYDQLNIHFDPHVNILFGDNAQGKTNILEAVFLCATTKSHRGSKDKDMIQFEEEEAHIRSFVRKNEISHKIDMHLRKNKTKGVAIDGLTIRKSSELFGMCNIIFFSPEDLGIIKNGPLQRRKFMDTELCQLDKIYLQYLAKYNKVLIQRNNLLKQISYRPELKDTLDVWDIQLVEYGNYIIKKRTDFIAQLNKIIQKKHEKLTGGRESIFLEYEPNINTDNFEKQLKEKREMDLRNYNTGCGPHRDDIKFLVNDIDIRRFGSQGQQRTAALSLKLSEIDIVKQRIKDTPILLLDDVLSELDSNRQNYLLNSIQDVQVIITCTGLDEFVKSRLTMNVVYEVVNGTIRQVRK